MKYTSEINHIIRDRVPLLTKTAISLYTFKIID